jgi:hemoglobin
MPGRLCALLLAPWLFACGGPTAPSALAGERPVAVSSAQGAVAAADSGQNVSRPATLLDRIGGRRVLDSVVDELLVDIFADNRINKFFESIRRDPARTKALRDSLVAFFCSRSGGTDCGPAPTRTLAEAHAGMPIAPAHVDAFLEDVRIALAVNHVDGALRDEVIGSMSDTKSQIAKESVK